MIRRFTGLFCLTALLALAAPMTEAGTIGLRWDPVAGAAGYRVYYGDSPGDYGQAVDAGGGTSTILNGLADCTDHFVAVKAYNLAGESESFSQEVSGWPAPEITSFGPGTVQQGDVLTMTLQGANFRPGTELRLTATPMPVNEQNEPLIRLESFSVTNCNRLDATVAIEPLTRGTRAMELGQFDLTFEVQHPDDVFGAEPATLTVTFDPARADINRVDTATRDRLDGEDLIWLSYAYNTNQGAPRFNPDADLTGDGTVDGDDLALLAVDFGDCWTGAGWSTAACD